MHGRGNLGLRLRGRHVMRHTVLRLVLACLLLGAGPVAAAPLEAYGRLPTIEDVAISPDAKHLAAITTDGDVRRVIVKSLSSGAVEAAVQAGRAKARSIDWAGNDHL